MDLNIDLLLSVELVLISAAAAILLSLIIKYFCGQFNYFRKQGIPGPRPIPIFGTWWKGWKHSTHEIGTRFYAEFGDVYCMFRGRAPVLRIQNPALVQSILVQDCLGHFDGRARRPVASGNDYVNNTLSLLHGEQAKFLRKLVIKGSSSRLVDLRFDMANTSILECVDHWNGRLDPSTTAGTMDLKIESEILCEEVMANYLFGMKLGLPGHPSHPFVVNARRSVEAGKQTWFGTLLQLYPVLLRWLSPILDSTKTDYFVEMSKRILEERRAQGPVANNNELNSDGDVVDRLLDCLNGRDMKGVEHIDEVVATAQIASNLLEGEDAASALIRVFYCLAVNSIEQQKCREEIRDALAKSNGELSRSVLDELHYLDACIREAMRLYAFTFAVNRICTKSKEYKGLFIPKGTLVEIPIFLIQRDPELYPAPLKYDPNRFLADGSLTNYYGFGQGPRSCPAQKLGTTVLKHCLVHALLQFEFFPVEETMDSIKLTSGPSCVLTAPELFVGFKKLS